LAVCKVGFISIHRLCRIRDASVESENNRVRSFVRGGFSRAKWSLKVGLRRVRSTRLGMEMFGLILI
jgi:hypothetical protein